jgi:hypothetical protein
MVAPGFEEFELNFVVTGTVLACNQRMNRQGNLHGICLQPFRRKKSFMDFCQASRGEMPSGWPTGSCGNERVMKHLHLREIDC